MIVSKVKTTEQLRLFDPPLDVTDHGYARHVVGELFEELSAIVLGGRRHRTDSRADYCPDISVDNFMYFNYAWCTWATRIQYYECKACGLSNQFMIYAGRLAKDRRFNQHRHLSYIVWSHSASTKQARTVNELRSLILQKINAAYIVPFNVIDELSASVRQEKLNSAYGASRTNGKVYGSGFRIPLRMIEDYKAVEYRLV